MPRKENFSYLYKRLENMQDRLILPQAHENSDPSWFGFMITCREPGMKDRLVKHLEENGIQTRMLFAGNLIKQPCFDELRNMGKDIGAVMEEQIKEYGELP